MDTRERILPLNGRIMARYIVNVTEMNEMTLGKKKLSKRCDGSAGVDCMLSIPSELCGPMHREISLLKWTKAAAVCAVP